MNRLSFPVRGACLLVACLLSACAGGSKTGGACCNSGAAVPVAKISANSDSTPVQQGASKAAGGASATGSAASKVREHVTDSMQREIVRETKPVIGDDSELRK